MLFPNKLLPETTLEPTNLTTEDSDKNYPNEFNSCITTMLFYLIRQTFKTHQTFIVHQNICFLRKNIDDLLSFLHQLNPDIDLLVLRNLFFSPLP